MAGSGKEELEVLALLLHRIHAIHRLTLDAIQEQETLEKQALQTTSIHYYKIPHVECIKILKESEMKFTNYQKRC